MIREIKGVKVCGVDVDAETRCAHYHSAIDIIAIKFKCCEQWFSCFECHAATTKHAPEVWQISERNTPAVLCGACGHQLSITEYFACDAICPRCQSGFNPGCSKHYDLYFETSADDK